MDLEETRQMLNKWFENKSVELFSKMLKGEGSREDNICDMQFLIRDYLGCGGIIEPNSYLEFCKKVLEEIDERMYAVDDFSQEFHGIRGVYKMSHDEAVKRNPNLTLDELKTFINAYLRWPQNRIFDYGQREKMREELLVQKREVSISEIKEVAETGKKGSRDGALDVVTSPEEKIQKGQSHDDK